MKKVTGNKVAIAIFVLPTLLLYTVLVFYPIIQTAIKSLYEWDGINIGEFVGLKHYIKLFTRDKTFKVSLINGLLFPLVTVVYQIGLGSVIAFTLASKKIRGRKFFRSAYFIPSTLSIVIVCKLWLAILASDASNMGLLNKLF